MRRKLPKYRTAEQAKRERALTAEWDKLLQKYPPAVVKRSTIRTTVTAELTLVLKRSRKTGLENAPSVGAIDRTFRSEEKPRLSQEMQERERLAQQEIERKKKQVAPAYNKGGLQLITNPDDFKTMGRKL